ncbi:MAG: hypothetical protein JXR29_03275, partial [Methylothermaceae bacterium]|nr:hypothetical protein [Methylothermaceae bacterium]
LQQAIETLQSFLESLRRRQLMEYHPAAGWELARPDTDTNTGKYTVRKIDNDAFATEWKYMGDYDAWRGAMSVFFFPENLLLPSLRLDASVSFKNAVKDNLRSKRRFTEEDLEPFLEPSPENPKRGGIYQNLSDDEKRYYMPMEVALRLQTTGDYLRALDWLRKVYPYDRPLAERKIGDGIFAQERNDAPLLHRPHDWILAQDPGQDKKEELNPHRIARLRNGTYPTNGKTPRSNPYSRYTLMAVARCFTDYADTEFVSETPESLARARNLYLSARTLLSLPELDPPTPLSPAEFDAGSAFFGSATVYPNPALDGLRQRVDVQLIKLREGRNIAGLKRQVEIPIARPLDSSVATIGIGGQLFVPGVRSLMRPTPYRYQVLIERSKQLVNIAQQVEANFLAAFEKRDKETYDLLQAKYGLQLANESVELQRRRNEGVRREMDLAKLQRARVSILQETYGTWLNTGLNRYERAVLSGNAQLRSLKESLRELEKDGAIDSAYLGALVGFHNPETAAFGGLNAILSADKIRDASSIKRDLILAEANLAGSEKRATFERRQDDWMLQKGLADQDALIADKQEEIARQHEQVSLQELRIAGVQAAQAEAAAVFLATKFTNAELYDWMSRVLREVYSYFLQQATSVAQLAQNQLAFERQDVPPAFIQAGYWQMPSEEAAEVRSQSTDRQGLTGSLRLLQDIYKLDQFAFETDKRKLNLSQTFSLASLLPYEFALFRESGVLPFVTSMHLFDEDFPGHYLRLIKRVRVSIVALIPPTRGIRATLRSGGISRVVTGDSFQEIAISRIPELVALTSPSNAGGVFDLDLQSDMLLPFEGLGVDARWLLEVPKAANPFDFGTIADVLFTVDYTALHSDEYRRQVIKRLPRKMSSELSLSIKYQFPDAWYDLNNPEQLEAQNQMVIRFKTTRVLFPPNVEDSTIRLDHLVLYFLRKNGAAFEIPVDRLSFSGTGGEASSGGAAISIDGIISTRNGSGGNWQSMLGMTPFGEWSVVLQNSS